jgi:hypothetical protein
MGNFSQNITFQDLVPIIMPFLWISLTLIRLDICLKLCMFCALQLNLEIDSEPMRSESTYNMGVALLPGCCLNQDVPGLERMWQDSMAG